MLSIDIGSILSLFVITCTAIAIFFTIEIIVFRKKDRTTLIYTANKYMQAIAVGVLLIPGYSGSTALMIIHNVLYFLGFAGEVYVILVINNTKYKLHKKVFLTGIAIAGLFNVISIITDSSSVYRIYVNGVFTLLLYIYFGLVLLLKKDSTRMQKATGWISFVFSIPWGLRTYYAITHFSTTAVLEPSLFQTSAYIGNIVYFTVLPMLYLFIIKEKDQRKLKEQYNEIILQNEKISSVNEELIALNTTKDKFFRIIGHDLKNPIGQMIQLFQIIEDKYKDLSNEQLIELIKTMKESSLRGFKLLENLLDWARSQTGDISFNPEPVLFSELIIENIELLEKQAETKKIVIKTSRLFDDYVTIDRNMINTVVRNLLSNAIKFTRNEGEIEISNHSDGENLITSFKDNGIGMSPEDSNRLFRIGSEYTAVGTNDEKGTGIGLILCKEFINKHKGNIWVESELERGSIFHFSIPLKTATTNNR